MQHLSRNAPPTVNQFPVNETHGIASLHNNRLLASSDGLGWRNLYAALVSEQCWSATVPAIDHYCLAYCLHSSALIKRRVSGVKPTDTAILQPRLFGTIPQGVESHWEVQGSPQVLLLYLHRTVVESTALELLEKDPTHIKITPILGHQDPLLEQLALSVLDSLRHRHAGSSLYADCLAQTMAVHLLHRYGSGAHERSPNNAAQSKPSGAGLQRVLDYIDVSLDENLSLERLAAEAGYSASLLSRNFHTQIGISPHKYVLDQRIDKAKRLLRQTSLPLVEIALNTGFSSQSHLSSTFRRYTGVTPGAYRSAGVSLGGWS